MAGFQKIEEIKAWQDARKLCKRVFEITDRESFWKDYRFRSQMNAAAGSIMDNIAEGFERGGNNEFKNFLRIAKGSTGELRSQAYRALDYGYIDAAEFKEINDSAFALGGKLKRLIDYLKSSDFRGTNY